MLSTGEEAFCAEYAKHGDQMLAFRTAFPSRTEGNRALLLPVERLLARPEVQARVTAIRQEVQSITGVNVATVLAHWWNLAMADPNEVVQYRRDCCRHCWGAVGQYQWTEQEYYRAVEKAVTAGKEAPSMEGGLDFDATRPPNAECTECHGQGVGEVFIRDTRDLSERGKLLLQSIEVGKYGPRVILNSRTDALNNVAKFLGMGVERVQIEDLTRKPDIEGEAVDLGKLDATQLTERFREIVEAGKPKQRGRGK